MIWLFERGDASMTIETRFDNASQEYELLWYEADGSVRREGFGTEAEFRVRLAAITEALHAEHWRQSGPPAIDPAGWRIG
jgi:hypothetical protein